MVLGVSVVVLEEGSVLLTKREDFRLWCLPGGIVDDGETLADAAVREVREETGLEAALERLVGIYSAPKFMRGGSHTALFVAHPTGGALRPDAKESLELGYFAPEELPEEMFWWQRPQIEDALSGAVGVVRTQEITGPNGGVVDFTELRESLEKGEVRLDAVQALLVQP